MATALIESIDSLAQCGVGEHQLTSIRTRITNTRFKTVSELSELKDALTRADMLTPDMKQLLDTKVSAIVHAKDATSRGRPN